MSVDVAELLHELDVTFSAGSSQQSWLLRAPDGTSFELELAPSAERLNAVRVRSTSTNSSNRSGAILHVGISATASVIDRARTGEFSILTSDPIRLIHAGRTYEATVPPPRPQPPRHSGKPAWSRWALQRYLLVTTAQCRQHAIADVLGTTQQSISRAAQALGSLVSDEGSGLFAPDRQRLLEHWLSEYPGPGGHEFGWYGLDTPVENVTRAVSLADELQIHTMVSGDVAADSIMPWKLPQLGRVYASGPIDLSVEGFTPAVLAEANLVVCIPRDPTLWRLSQVALGDNGEHTLPLADAAIVYWDLLMSGEQDSDEAAEHLSKILTGDRQ